jgi:hypothetical protein
MKIVKFHMPVSKGSLNEKLNTDLKCPLCCSFTIYSLNIYHHTFHEALVSLPYQNLTWPPCCVINGMKLTCTKVR